MSTLKEFLYELSEELRFLPAKQVNEILKHYRDKVNVEVDYGADEEKVISEMKSPKEIAKGIYEMHDIDYLAKRKQISKLKNIFNIIIFSFAILASMLIFIVGSIFIITIIINMFTLLGGVLKFTNTLDVVVSFIFVLYYILIVLCLYIFIIDIFLVLINSLLTKILNSIEKTRGKEPKFLHFTINGWLNKISKRKNILFKVLVGLLAVFLIFGITSYATKGRVYRSINDINSNKEIYKIQKDFNNIIINGNNAYIILMVSDSLTSPQIEYEYEFSSLDYRVGEDGLIINVGKDKTYDFLGLLKSPRSVVRVILPSNYKINDTIININYGKIVLDNFSSSGKMEIKTINASLSLNENQLDGDLSINTDSSSIIFKGNEINNLVLNQQSGSLIMSEDNITNFVQQNGSSSVKLVDEKITNYTFSNNSGTIYLERIMGSTIDYKTSTSLNELYDIYFGKGIFKVQNTASFKITRSKFSKSVEIESSGSSHQTISYMSSPQISLIGKSGQIICEYINKVYSEEQINKFDENYQQYIKHYNDLVSSRIYDTNITINSNSCNVSLNGIDAKSMEFTINKASTAIVDINIVESTFNANDTGVEMTNYYGQTLNLNLRSTEYNVHTNVEYYNDHASDIVVNLTKDGMSEIIYSDFIDVRYESGQ